MKLTSIQFVNEELVVVCNVCNPDASPQKPMWSMDESGGNCASRHINYVHPELIAYAD